MSGEPGGASRGSAAGRMLVLALVLGLAWFDAGCGADEEEASSEKPTAEVLEPPQQTRIGLALSGGGYRATIHGLAALKALHQRGELHQVEIRLRGLRGELGSGLLRLPPRP